MPNGFPKEVSRFKLIVSDFDGTLAGADHKISENVQLAIKKWIDTGRHFAIASGRQYLMIGQDAKVLNLITPFIVRGGAEIVDSVNGKVLFSEVMNKETVKKFADTMIDNGYGLRVEMGDTLYGNIDYDISHYTGLKLKSFEEMPYEDSPKLVVRVPKDRVKEMELFMKETVMPQFPQLHMVRSYNMLGMSWDVTSAKATKHLAVLKLMQILNIKREDSVGVGDGYNDFPLLQACELKVAMGNANDELKAIADVVVPSLENDGVAYLIDQLLKS